MLSIIIPTLNEEKYLPRLLESIRKQSYKDYEVIVSDAFSKDRTREIARSFGCKIVDGGLPGKARNNGARVSKGNLLLFLDADVFMDNKDFLKLLLYKHKKKRFVMASGFILPDNKDFLDQLLMFLGNVFNFLFQKIYHGVQGPYMFVEKEYYDKVNGFDEKIILGEDVDFSYRVSKIGKLSFLIRPSLKISMRRFHQEGRLKLSGKYIKVGFYKVIHKDLRKHNVDYDFKGYN